MLEVGDVPDNHCVHHINMDDQDNRLENFIALSRNQHHISHGTFNRLCKDLMDKGFVKFDLELLAYVFTDKFDNIAI